MRQAFVAVCRAKPGWCGKSWGKLSAEAIKEREEHERTCRGQLSRPPVPDPPEPKVVVVRHQRTARKRARR